MVRGIAVKTHVLVLIGVVAVSSNAAGAQEMLPPPTPPPPQQVSATAAAEPTPPVIDMARRRQQIGFLEGMLVSAVRQGASETASQIQQVEPGLNLLTGTARARGFFLEGYGVFFHVEIPAVQPSVQWIVETIERARQLQQQGGQASLASARSPAPMLDANALYTAAVQRKLIDAMLDLRIDLLPDEWLTVAARDAAGPLPGEIYESITMVLRIKGSDLSDFQAGRITADVLRKRVEVREF